ncbi:MAG: AarF/ABC1/UbiB kinase family protein [Polyangia bacterium]
MSRSTDRFFGDARARLRKLATSARQALSVDEPTAQSRDDAERDFAHAVAEEAGKLRGAPAKVAQLRAYLELDDALSTSAREELATLWDGVPPDPPQAIRRVVEEDLGAPIEELFATWDEEPFAAASLGQVHGATLADGTEVAVKVQYPGIAAALADDLGSTTLLRDLVGPGLGAGVAKDALEAVRSAMLREVDYVAERVALERFGRAFFGDAQIVLPRAYADRSSARVLTMTRLRGRNLADLGDATPDERAQVARTLFRFMFGGPLKHGLVNGDPHPGNYLVLDAAAGKVGFLDFGFVVEIGALQEIERGLWLSIVRRDGEGLRYFAHEAGLVPHPSIFDHAAWRDFEHALGAPFLKRGAKRFGRGEAGELARSVRHLVSAGSVHLPPAAVVLWRQRIAALAVIGSLEASLDLRRVLCEVLDDDRHPTPLYERYR